MWSAAPRRRYLEIEFPEYVGDDAGTSGDYLSAVMTNPLTPIHAIPAALLLTAALATACTSEPPSSDRSEPTTDATQDTGRTFVGHGFERNVVFLTTRSDSAIVVPWLVTARTRPGGVDRTARGFLARNGAWEPFFQSTWETSPTRVPWRILPRESMRLIVGDEENLDRIVFEEGSRQLHVILEDALVEWSGQRGETFRLVEGSLLLSSQRVAGIALDMARARRADDGPLGGWAFLTSGDSLQVVLHSPRARPPGAVGAWRGWARTANEAELQWPALTLAWESTRAFEQARREVPSSWSLASPDGELRGAIEAQSSWLDVGEGEGPQLPVDALFEVGGTVTLDGGDYPVQGLVRYEQH